MDNVKKNGLLATIEVIELCQTSVRYLGKESVFKYCSAFRPCRKSTRHIQCMRLPL